MDKWVCFTACCHQVIEFVNRVVVLPNVDPDAPSRNDPKFREWHHWLVVNIPGSDVSKGDAVAEYIGAGPPKGTGLHRYVFLAYKQTGKVNFSDPHRTNR